MAKDPTYPMYAQDFDMDTSFWSLEEIGIYIRLLNACWINNGIPNDVSKLARISRVSKAEFESHWYGDLKDKFYEKDGQLFNKKQEEVRQYRTQQKVNGSKGGRPKKIKKEKPNQNQTETQTKTESKPKRKVSNEIEVEYEIEKGIEKGGVGEKGVPSLEEFEEYAISKKPDVDLQAVGLKFEAWKESGWRTGGKNGHKIKNWKSTLLNTLPYLKKVESESLSATDKLRRKHGIASN